VIYLSEAPNEDELAKHIDDSILIRAPIPHGDVAWFGLWTGGSAIRVAGERKRVGDLIGSIESGRHLQQVQDTRAAGFDQIFLVVEGEYRRHTRTGQLQIPRKTWVDHPSGVNFSRVEDYLSELTFYAHVPVFRTRTVRDTAYLICGLYRIFQRAPESHSSLKAFHTPPPPAISLKGRPGIVRRVAKEFQGIGWERAEVIERAYPTLDALFSTTVEALAKLDGIGPKTAQSILREVRGG